MRTDGHPSDAARILIIDDSLDNLAMLSEALAQEGYVTKSIADPIEGLELARTMRPDLILLDVRMPGMDGFEVCRRLKRAEVTRSIPILFLSALDEAADKVRAFEVGGADYITKPLHLDEVYARIRHQLELHGARAEINAMNRDLEARVAQRTRELEQALRAHRETQSQLLDVALRDPLTHLMNRGALLSELERVLARSRTKPAPSFAVIILDCDRFKNIVSSLGHRVGDQLLVGIAERLRDAINPDDIVSRLGSDEFAVVLEHRADRDELIGAAHRLHELLSIPFNLSGVTLYVTASVGIVLGEPRYTRPEHLLRDADGALALAKRHGPGGFEVFSQAIQMRALADLNIENALRRAVEREEFTLHFQPILRMHDRSILGFEALIRWRHPSWGLTQPGEFIERAEEIGIIRELDLWVLEQAIAQLAAWRARIGPHPALAVNVNVSAAKLLSIDLLHHVEQVLERYNVPGDRLGIELTETRLMEHPQEAVVLLKALKSHNVRIYVDDFGTGYSSLAYLRRFPLDALKIDKLFVRSVLHDEDDRVIVRTIIAMARQLGLEITAEGIESEQQLTFLRDQGCHAYQGFLTSPPVPADEALSLLSLPVPSAST